MNKKSIGASLLRLSALTLCVLPVSLAILSYFPIWLGKGASTALSGISLLLLFIAQVPLFRALKQYFASPSAPLIWFVLFVIFFMLSKIADDMTVIALVGFAGNLIGSVLFKLAARLGRSGEEKNEG